MYRWSPNYLEIKPIITNKTHLKQHSCFVEQKTSDEQVGEDATKQSRYVLSKYFIVNFDYKHLHPPDVFFVDMYTIRLSTFCFSKHYMKMFLEFEMQVWGFTGVCLFFF